MDSVIYLYSSSEMFHHSYYTLNIEIEIEDTIFLGEELLLDG